MESIFTQDLSMVIGYATSGDTNLRLPFRISEKTEALRIEILDLTPRSFNSLKRNNVSTVGDVVNKFAELEKLRNVGHVSLREIKRKTCDTLYEAMSVNDRKTFWRDFIKENHIQGISAK